MTPRPRPIVIDREALGAPERSGPRDIPWWRACTPEEFQEELDRMSLDEIESLASEVNAATGATGSTANDTSLSQEARWRARRALSNMVQRKKMVAAASRRRQTANYEEQGVQRDRVVREVREFVRMGDLEGGLLRLLDWVESFGDKRRRGPP